MKLASAHSPINSVSPTTLLSSFLLTAIFIIMILSQLMTYEKFVPIIQNYQLFNSPPFGKVFSALIVIFEIMALPFLLRMELSRLLRFVSAGCLIAVSTAWAVLGFWASLNHSPLIGTGLLGGILKPTSLDIAIIILFGAFLLIGSVIVTWRLRFDFK